MARPASRMAPRGSKAPDFSLPDAVSGEVKTLDELISDKATVVMFICNHCPFVKHVQHELVRLAEEYAAKDAAFIAISANDAASYPEDAPDRMRAVAQELHYPFPFLYDETQETARAYDAACTPDFYLYDGGLRLVYRGQLDDSRPGNGVPVTGKDLRAALDALLSGRPLEMEQKPSIGCGIKWKE